jgi:hypothetical protein
MGIVNRPPAAPLARLQFTVNIFSAQPTTSEYPFRPKGSCLLFFVEFHNNVFFEVK